MSSQLFRIELDEVFRSPVNATQLKQAVKADRAWREWERERSVKAWKKFLSVFCKLEVN